MSDDKAIRSGAMALELATCACELSGWQDWTCLAALAAAHAEAGDFEETAQWASRSLDLAPDPHKDSCRSRLQLYQSQAGRQRAAE